MNWYERRILPRLTDLAMRHQVMRDYRAQVVPQARGQVLEIGAGSGLNLPFYGAQVTQLHALEPSPGLLQMMREQAHNLIFPVFFLPCSAEAIPLDDASIDTVVMTWTLCTIPDPTQALAEIRRVLRPHGSLLFAEHGCAPEANVRAWQDRLNPLWGHIAGGCNLNRRIDYLVRDANFTIVALETGYAKGPRPMAYMYAGRAQPVTLA